MSLEVLVQIYGYYVLALGALIQSSVIMIIAGFMANQKNLSLPLVIIIGTCGSFICNQICFYIGRYGKNKVINKKSSWKKKSEVINKFVKKYESYAIIILRFVQGAKIVSSIFFGTTSIKKRKFTALNLIASLIWATVFALIGFFFGLAAQAIFGKIEIIQTWVIIILIIVWLLYLVKKRLGKPSRSR